MIIHGDENYCDVQSKVEVFNGLRKGEVSLIMAASHVGKQQWEETHVKKDTTEDKLRAGSADSREAPRRQSTKTSSL